LRWDKSRGLRVSVLLLLRCEAVGGGVGRGTTTRRGWVLHLLNMLSRRALLGVGGLVAATLLLLRGASSSLTYIGGSHNGWLNGLVLWSRCWCRWAPCSVVCGGVKEVLGREVLSADLNKKETSGGAGGAGKGDLEVLGDALFEARKCVSSTSHSVVREGVLVHNRQLNVMLSIRILIDEKVEVFIKVGIKVAGYGTRFVFFLVELDNDVGVRGTHRFAVDEVTAPDDGQVKAAHISVGDLFS